MLPRRTSSASTKAAPLLLTTSSYIRGTSTVFLRWPQTGANFSGSYEKLCSCSEILDLLICSLIFFYHTSYLYALFKQDFKEQFFILCDRLVLCSTMDLLLSTWPIVPSFNIVVSIRTGIFLNDSADFVAQWTLELQWHKPVSISVPGQEQPVPHNSHVPLCH